MKQKNIEDGTGYKRGTLSMKWIVTKKKEVAGSYIEISAGRIGEDILLSVEGGSKPHIGCVVQAVPRTSLTGDGSRSTTASVLNLTGHKDEYLCRKLAEKVCSGLGVVTVCTGGFHIDGMTKEQIREVLQATEEIAEEIVKF